MRKIRQFILGKMGEAEAAGGGGLDRLVEVLGAVVECGYVEMNAVIGIKGVVDVFVERNVLQYACRDYVGVYRWNRECRGDEEESLDAVCGGGGFCGGLDIVAPSNRAALIALYLALPGAPRSRPLGFEVYEGICGLGV